MCTTVKTGVAQRVGKGQEHRDDRELADFDAEIERDQRQQQRSLRQAEIGQHAGEAEAVDQAEAERDDPASAVDDRADVVERGQHHRQRRSPIRPTATAG